MRLRMARLEFAAQSFDKQKQPVLASLVFDTFAKPALAGVRSAAAAARQMVYEADGLAVDAGHIAARSGVRCVIDLEHVPLAEGADIEDIGFGEDYELLAAVEEPGRFHVIGRCAEGSGVEIRLRGEPVALTGWDHFRKQDPDLR